MSKSDDARLAKLVKKYTEGKLAELRESFESGRDPGAVLHAIFISFGGGVDVPQWAQREFRRIYAGVLHGRRQEWFKPPRTPKQTERFLRYMQAQPKVWRMVAEAHEVDRKPINDALFFEGRQEPWRRRLHDSQTHVGSTPTACLPPNSTTKIKSRFVSLLEIANDTFSS